TLLFDQARLQSPTRPHPSDPTPPARVKVRERERERVYERERERECVCVQYQFNPAFFQTSVTAQILLKALTNLPHTDFTLCKCMIEQTHVSFPRDSGGLLPPPSDMVKEEGV
uniref:Uncharacterized protein n=1 Tax=Callorhinchus milii TaxID=7868 RepID=A0A4W3GE38_CALMI